MKRSIFLCFFLFVPKINSFSFRWSSSRLCNNNCWRRLVNRIFATWFLKNLNYLFFYSSYSGKIQNIDMVTHLQWQIIVFSFFIFSIRSWNQDKDKFWICFLLSITKRIGHFYIPNMRSKYLPSFRWALHKQTDNETWLVINNPSWLIIVNRSTTTKHVWWKAHKMGLLIYNHWRCLTS